MGNLFQSVDKSEYLTESKFTALAEHSLNKFISSESFSSDADADLINAFLQKQTFNISFGRHLKRYIRSHHDFHKNKHDVTDEEIYRYLCDSFKTHEIPPKPSITQRNLKGWLTQRSVRRATVFSLGFGLDMSAKDVTTFLVKVLNENDFDFTNKTEVVYHYCFRHHYPYSKAAQLLAEYPSVDADLPIEKISPAHIGSDHELCVFLKYLDEKKSFETNQQKAYAIYCDLYKDVANAIADVYNQDYQRDLSFMGFFSKLRKKPVQYTAEAITDYDVEQALYNAIPLDNKGNLQKLLASNLKDAFRGYRLSRQRMSNITLHKQDVERYDLLTLLFYLHARKEEGLDSVQRTKNFIDQANELLSSCDMMQLYVANSYEAFLLLCLMDSYPLNCFSDVWETSYGIDAE